MLCTQQRPTARIRLHLFDCDLQQNGADSSVSDSLFHPVSSSRCKSSAFRSNVDFGSAALHQSVSIVS